MTKLIPKNLIKSSKTGFFSKSGYTSSTSPKIYKHHSKKTGEEKIGFVKETSLSFSFKQAIFLTELFYSKKEPSSDELEDNEYWTSFNLPLNFDQSKKRDYFFDPKANEVVLAHQIFKKLVWQLFRLLRDKSGNKLPNKKRKELYWFFCQHLSEGAELKDAYADITFPRSCFMKDEFAKSINDNNFISYLDGLNLQESHLIALHNLIKLIKTKGITGKAIYEEIELLAREMNQQALFCEWLGNIVTRHLAGEASPKIYITQDGTQLLVNQCGDYSLLEILEMAIHLDNLPSELRELNEKYNNVEAFEHLENYTKKILNNPEQRKQLIVTLLQALLIRYFLGDRLESRRADNLVHNTDVGLLNIDPGNAFSFDDRNFPRTPEEVLSLLYGSPFSFKNIDPTTDYFGPLNQHQRYYNQLVTITTDLKKNDPNFDAELQTIIDSTYSKIMLLSTEEIAEAIRPIMLHFFSEKLFGNNAAQLQNQYHEWASDWLKQRVKAVEGFFLEYSFPGSVAATLPFDNLNAQPRNSCIIT